jgi:Leucine rich repeat
MNPNHDHDDAGGEKPVPSSSSSTSSKPKRGAVSAAIRRFEKNDSRPPDGPTVTTNRAHQWQKKPKTATIVTPPVSPRKVATATATATTTAPPLPVTPVAAASRAVAQTASLPSPASSSPSRSSDVDSSPQQSSTASSDDAVGTNRSLDNTLSTMKSTSINSNSFASRSKRTAQRMAMDGVPKHVIPLPPPPSDCDSVNMSTGSVTLTVFSQDSFVHGDGEGYGGEEERGGSVLPPPQLPTIPTSPHAAPMSPSASVVSGQQEEEQENALSCTELPSMSPPVSPISMSHHTKQPTKSSLRSGHYSNSSNNNNNNNNSHSMNGTDSTGTSSPDHPYSQSSSTSKKKKTSFSPLPPQECVIPDEDRSPISPKGNKRGSKKGRSERSSNSNRRQKKSCQKTAMYYLFGVALCLIIVAVGVNLLLYFDRKDGQSESSSGAPTTVVDDDAVVENFNNNDGIASPTLAPASTAVAPSTTSDVADDIAEILSAQFRVTVPAPSNGSGDNSPVRQSVDWLAGEISSSGGDPAATLENYKADLVTFAQRFALLVLRYSLVGGENLNNSTADVSKFMEYPTRNVDECQWTGVVCDSVTGRVVEIDYSDIGLDGSIPPEIRLLPSLKVLDLSHNEIKGSIPEETFDLRQLQKLYLYMNQLQGSISTWIGQLTALEVLHASHNNLSGRIPQQLQSNEGEIRPLKYLNLQSNLLSGSIPSGLRLGEVAYFDLGRNELTGTIPDDLGSDFVELRHLLLDHNGLIGSIPTTIPIAGSGSLETLELHHNALTGRVPDNFSMYNKLVQYRLDSNNFDSMGPQNCLLSLFNNYGGELIEFKADCDICTCNDRFCEDMCDAQLRI